VVEKERRLQQALRSGGRYRQRSLFGRVRAWAVRDGLEVAERLADMARVRDDLDRVLDALGVRRDGDAAARDPLSPSAPGRRTKPPAHRRNPVPDEPPPADGVYEGDVEVEIGPLDDFAQLTGFEDAAAAIGGASEIEVRRFSGGRARLAMSLDQPVELLRELEERSPLEFKVRAVRGQELLLDMDGDRNKAP
jgi:hypothetical protein